MLEWPEVIVIGTVALLFFGPKRLPEMAQSVGKSIKEFRKATQDGMQNLTEASQKQANCPSCNHLLKEDEAKFCPNCGKTMAKPAP